MALKICLIGPLPKGDEVRKGWTDWKAEYKEKLSQIPGIEFTDGDAWRDETKPLQLVGHDAYLVKTADVVVVHAGKKLGTGTAQEMVIAKYFSKPVIAVLPKETHHRRSHLIFDGTEIDDWIHPFVLLFSDFVAENIDNCISWIKELHESPKSKEIKGITVIDEAIDSYLNGNE